MAIRETLDNAINLYKNYLNAQRTVAAGYDYCNVDHNAEEKAAQEKHDITIKGMVGELKANGFYTKDDLAKALLAEGIYDINLDLVQTPYLNGNEKNPLYAKEYAGFGFDDVRAVDALLSLLPNGAGTEYNELTKNRRAAREQELNLEREERDLDKKIRDKFSGIGYMFGWSANKDEICYGDIEDRVAVKRDFYNAVRDTEGDERYKAVIRWYDGLESHKNLRVYVEDKDREFWSKR